MESINEINIKNRTYYFFNDMININPLPTRNLNTRLLVQL